MRLSRAASCSGLSATTIWMVEQLGLAMMPAAWHSATSSGFTSGTTSGTSGSMRKALELSMTTAPASAAMGANSRETAAPGEKSAMSTPAKESGLRRRTVTLVAAPREPLGPRSARRRAGPARPRGSRAPPARSSSRGRRRRSRRRWPPCTASSMTCGEPLHVVGCEGESNGGIVLPTPRGVRDRVARCSGRAAVLQEARPLGSFKSAAMTIWTGPCGMAVGEGLDEQLAACARRWRRRRGRVASSAMACRLRRAGERQLARVGDGLGRREPHPQPGERARAQAHRDGFRLRPNRPAHPGAPRPLSAGGSDELFADGRAHRRRGRRKCGRRGVEG